MKEFNEIERLVGLITHDYAIMRRAIAYATVRLDTTSDTPEGRLCREVKEFFERVLSNTVTP